MSRISLIAALGKKRELGFQGNLLWHLPDDMRRFKELTLGHPVIMGRKTWESLPERFRPLPGRTNIVVTRHGSYEATGAVVTDSLPAALFESASATGGEEVFVIGGGELYAAALPHATHLYLTLVDASAPADVFFPQYEEDFKITTETTGEGEPPHRFLTLERK